MSRTFYLPLMVLLLSACEEDHGGSTVQFEIDGAEGRMVYFDRYQNARAQRVDSVELSSSGKGRISLPPLPLDFYRISMGDEQLIVALDSTEDLSVHAKAGTLADPEKVEGSRHSEKLQQFLSDQREYEAKLQQLRQQLSSDPSNTETIKELNALNQQHYANMKTFIVENSDSPVALNAISKFDLQGELDLYKKVRNDLRKVMPASTFFNQYRQRVDQFEQQMVAMRMQEEEQKRLESFLAIGSEAPEIRQQTPDGGTYALSEMRGKVVLIDFWASWCRPCRIENPAVKKVYEKYRRKGFDILGVSLDKSQQAWISAIQQDGLPWKHVSDLGFWQNEAAQEYGVQSIPFTVLVDRDGKIIAKGLRAHDLETTLAQLFGS